MSLHFETTAEADHRAMWGRIGRVVASLLIAGGFIWAAMMGLDSMSSRLLSVDRPQFVLVAENTFGTGGGCGGCSPGAPIHRLPSAPEMRPLGLALKKIGGEVFHPEDFQDIEAAKVEFEDGDYFGLGMSSCGSFD
jgi:hypothetical protein